jgi:hypothetical protein
MNLSTRARAMTLYSLIISIPTTSSQPADRQPMISLPLPENGTMMRRGVSLGGGSSRVARCLMRAMLLTVGWTLPWVRSRSGRASYSSLVICVIPAAVSGVRFQ